MLKTLPSSAAGSAASVDAGASVLASVEAAGAASVDAAGASLLLPQPTSMLASIAVVSKALSTFFFMFVSSHFLLNVCCKCLLHLYSYVGGCVASI